MTAKKPDDKVLDDLLKTAFADDLPADVAAGMRLRLDRFRAGTIRDQERPAAPAWFFRRSVWAVVSVLMLVSGMVLQGAGARNALADRIAVIKTGLASPEPVRRPAGAPELRDLAPAKEPARIPEDKEKTP